MIKWIRKKFLTLIYPFLRFMGKAHMLWSRKQIEASHVYYLLELLEPGDVLLTTTYGQATNLIIPGSWKHAGIYVGDTHVIEAVHPEVRMVNLWEFALSKDRICVVRSTDHGPAEIKLAVQNAKQYVGTPYDYQFSRANKALYCSETVYASLKSGKLDWKFVPRDIWGEMTIKPEDFLLAKKYFELVFVSH